MMITKKDLQNAEDVLAELDRRSHGEPPTAEQMLAYSRGELAPAEEARVRALLVSYPELADTLTVPFPEDDAQPGELGHLSAAEVEQRWSAMKSRIGAGTAAGAIPPRVDDAPTPAAVVTPRQEMGRVLRFWRAAAALAAMLVLVLGGLLLQARKESQSLALQLSMPRMAGEAQLLYPEGRRGGAEVVPTLTRDGDSYLLLASLREAPQYAEFRVEIVDAGSNPPRVRWSSTTVLRAGLDTFAVVIPHAFLPPGRYEMILYGVSGSRNEKLSSFAMRVPAP
jgi:hypothetical protein